MRDRSADYAGKTEFADRLALTSRDRRLESLVLLEMIRSAARNPDSPPKRGGSGETRAGEASNPADDASIYEHALHIASFLVEEFGFQALDEKIYASELAVELVQRITEDLADASAWRRKSPTD